MTILFISSGTLIADDIGELNGFVRRMNKMMIHDIHCNPVFTGCGDLTSVRTIIDCKYGHSRVPKCLIPEDRKTRTFCLDDLSYPSEMITNDDGTIHEVPVPDGELQVAGDGAFFFQKVTDLMKASVVIDPELLYDIFTELWLGHTNRRNVKPRFNGIVNSYYFVTVEDETDAHALSHDILDGSINVDDIPEVREDRPVKIWVVDLVYYLLTLNLAFRT